MVRRALRDFTVEPMTRTLFIRGMDRYAARLDKEYSHVDCMSMIVMEDLAIQHVLTNDHHFQQEGFTLVNA
jgi:predicted nucleic acid-binding protein